MLANFRQLVKEHPGVQLVEDNSNSAQLRVTKLDKLKIQIWNKNVFLWPVVINSLSYQINGSIHLALIYNVQHICIDQDQLIKKEIMVVMCSENKIVLDTKIVYKTSDNVMLQKHRIKLPVLVLISQDISKNLLHSNVFMMTA
jgi:hypothetical protein